MATRYLDVSEILPGDVILFGHGRTFTVSDVYPSTPDRWMASGTDSGPDGDRSRTIGLSNGNYRVKRG